MITLMSFLVAAGGDPDVFPGGCWWLLVAAGGCPDVFPGGCW